MVCGHNAFMQTGTIRKLLYGLWAQRAYADWCNKKVIVLFVTPGHNAQMQTGARRKLLYGLWTVCTKANQLAKARGLPSRTDAQTTH